MNEVRNRMQGHMFLQNMVVQLHFVKKIADFVRYKTNAMRQIQMTQLKKKLENF